MRKSLWFLLLLPLLLIPVAIGWTSLLKSDGMLRRHEARVTEDISALRSRLRKSQAVLRNSDLHRSTLDFLRQAAPSRPPGMDWLKVIHPDSQAIAWVLKNWCDSGNFYPYEDGGSSSIFAIWASWEEADYSSPERIPIALGILYEFGQGGSVQWGGQWRKTSDELHLLGEWSRLLEKRTFAPEFLERMAADLDRLWQGRPTLASGIEVEYVYLSRAVLLQILEPERKGFSTDHERLIQPGWRSLYSRKVFAVRMLNEFEQDLAVLSRLRELPTWESPSVINRRIREQPLHHRELHRDLPKLLEREVEVQRVWALARVATGIARYQAENRAFPPDLETLVPRYLGQVPECPQTGRPLVYRSGEVASPGAPSKIWKLKPQ